MKFGKLNDPHALNLVDFNLPAIPLESKAILNAHVSEKTLRVHIGCPMWGNKAWIGKLYPAGAKAGDFLTHYARAFNGIELNSTHYRIPTAETVARWRDQVSENADFLFSPKIPQFISHRYQLINCEAPLREFTDAIRGFGDALGCSFVQLPPAFGTDKLPNLQAFLAMWPSDLPLAIEFRDASWFQFQSLLPAARETLAAFRTHALITDVAGRRDVCHIDLTGTTAMIRFVGNGLVPTDYSRADAWVNTIADLAKEGLQQVYLFMHEPDDTFAPDMGIYFIGQLNITLGLDIHKPVLGEIPGAQMSLF